MGKNSNMKSDKKPARNLVELPDCPVDENGLTPRQLKILQAIKIAMDEKGYPPSMREIGEAAGLASPSSVKYQLEALEEKGWIRRDPSRGRALEVLTPGDDRFKILLQNEHIMFRSLDALQPAVRFWLNRMLRNFFHYLPLLLVRVNYLCSKLLAIRW